MNSNQTKCINDLVRLDKSIAEARASGTNYSEQSLIEQAERYSIFSANEKSFGGFYNLINLVELQSV